MILACHCKGVVSGKQAKSNVGLKFSGGLQKLLQKAQRLRNIFLFMKFNLNPAVVMRSSPHHCSSAENVETGANARKQVSEPARLRVSEPARLRAIFGAGVLKYIEHENGEADVADVPVSTVKCRTTAGFRFKYKSDDF